MFIRRLEINASSFSPGDISDMSVEIMDKLVGMREYTSAIAHAAISCDLSRRTMTFLIDADVDSDDIADRAVSAWVRTAILLAGLGSAGWESSEVPELGRV